MNSSPQTRRSRRTKLDYPRKRASIACDICRLRKTRCDAAKPVCSFCAEIDAECTYRKPTLGDRPRREDDPLAKIVERLERMENHILNTQTSAQLQQQLAPGPPILDSDKLSSQVPSPDSYPGPHQGWGQMGTHETELLMMGPSPVSHTSSHYTRVDLLPPVPSGPDLVDWKPPDTHEICLPNLESFSCLPPFNHIQYDEGEAYFQTEVKQGALLYGLRLPGPLDTTPKTCWKLQTLFAKNVLPWIPLFDQRYCMERVASAARTGFQTGHVSVALVMFIFALGAVSNEDDNVNDAPETFAGIEYFLEGCRLVDTNRAETNTITSVQCRILWAMYLLYCMRPLQAWNVILEAMRDVIVLCHLKGRMEADPLFKEMARRAYWASYILEYELRGQIGFHARELHKIHNTMELPSSDTDEPGFFYFLSEIALRQLLANVVDNIGISAGHTRYAPVVAFELCTQLQEWYANLPNAVRFPLDSTPILDPQKAFLKAQYYSTLCITKWAFIVRFVAQHPDFRGEQDILVAQGRECLEAAVQYIDTIEMLMHFRHMLIFPNFIGLYCQTLILLVTYHVPQLHQLQVPDAGAAITKALTIMRTWRENPSVRVGVDRISALMERVGLGGGGDVSVVAGSESGSLLQGDFGADWDHYGRVGDVAGLG